MHTETVTYLKENANKLELDEPLVVTQNGKAKYVVQNYEDFQYQQDSIALLKLLILSEQSEKIGEMSIDQAFED